MGAADAPSSTTATSESSQNPPPTLILVRLDRIQQYDTDLLTLLFLADPVLEDMNSSSSMAGTHSSVDMGSSSSTTLQRLRWVPTGL